MSTVTLRRMCEGDIDNVCAIEARVFATPWSKQSFTDEMSNQLAVYIVAEAGGRVIGYIGAWRVLDEGHITNLAVEAEWRRQGVGAGLLAAMEELLEGEGIRRITLEVRVSNAPAIHLYRQRGYRERGVRKKYYQDNGEDAFIMWKHKEDMG